MPHANQAALTAKHSDEMTARAAIHFREKTSLLKTACEALMAESQARIVGRVYTLNLIASSMCSASMTVYLTCISVFLLPNAVFLPSGVFKHELRLQVFSLTNSILSIGEGERRKHRHKHSTYEHLPLSCLRLAKSHVYLLQFQVVVSPSSSFFSLGVLYQGML